MILVRVDTLVYPATGVNVLFEDYSGGIAEMKAQVEANNIIWDAVVFRGTRVPVKTLFDYLEGGETLDRFLDQFPSVSTDG